MKCPNCKKDDSLLLMTERKGIEIDYCPECRGVWLDRGELDKIIEKYREESASISSSPPPHQGNVEKVIYRDPNHYKERKKKSFFEELFD